MTDDTTTLRLWRVQYYRRVGGTRATMAVWAPTRSAAADICVEVAHRGVWGFESPVLAVDDITGTPAAYQYGRLPEAAWRLDFVALRDCFVAFPLPYSGAMP